MHAQERKNKFIKLDILFFCLFIVFLMAPRNLNQYNRNITNGLSEKLRGFLFDLNYEDFVGLRSLFTNSEVVSRNISRNNSRINYSNNYNQNFNNSNQNSNFNRNYSNNYNRNNYRNRNYNNYSNQNSNGIFNQNFNQSNENNNLNRNNNFNNNDQNRYQNNRNSNYRNNHRNVFNNNINYRNNFRRNNSNQNLNRNNNYNNFENRNRYFYNRNNNVNNSNNQNNNQNFNRFNGLQNLGNITERNNVNNGNRNFNNNRRQFNNYNNNQNRNNQRNTNRENNQINNNFEKPTNYQNIPIRKIEKILNYNNNLLRVKGTCWNHNTGKDLKFRGVRREKINLPFVINNILTPQRHSDSDWNEIKVYLKNWRNLFNTFLNFNRLQNHGILVNTVAKCNGKYLNEFLSDINIKTENILTEKFVNKIDEIIPLITNATNPLFNLYAMKIATKEFKNLRKFNIWQYYKGLIDLMKMTYDNGIEFINPNIASQNLNNDNQIINNNNQNNNNINNTISLETYNNNSFTEIIEVNNEADNTIDDDNQTPSDLFIHCQFCNTESSSNVDMIRHIKRCARINLKEGDKCKECGHTFHDKEDVINHLPHHWDFRSSGPQIME